ncbi:MAG: reverse transcriptase family protein [Sedimenticola sp.]
MLSWNVNGLSRKLVDPDFLEFVNNYDILFLSETWLAPNNCTNLNIQGYESDHIFGNKNPNTKKGRYSGGISIYYKASMKTHVNILQKQQCGIMWVKLSRDLFVRKHDVYMCHVYVPPSGSRVLDHAEVEYFDEIESGIEQYTHLGKIFITGDMNSRTSNIYEVLDFDRYLDDENQEIADTCYIPPRVNKDHMIDTKGRSLINMCMTTGLIIANGRLHNDNNIGQYTYCSHNGMSVVDYLLMKYSDKDHISDFKILEFNEFSDHAPLLLCLQTEQTPRESRTTQTCKQTTQKLVWDESKVPIFRNQLMNNHETLQRLTEHINNSPVDRTVETFTNCIYENGLHAFGKTFNQQRANITTKTSKPWYDHECIRAKHDFKRARNTFVKHMSDDNRKLFVKTRTIYTRTKRKAKQRYKLREGERLCNIANKQPKQFWKEIKKLYANKNTTPDDNIDVNDLYDHFKTLFGERGNTNFQPQTAQTENLDADLDTDITEPELRTAVFSQNNGKCPGIDNLNAELFKSSYDIISTFLLKLYNLIFNSGEFPSSWGDGMIVPIFKGGKSNEAKNYRAITLINLLGKIYSQILLNRVTKWSEKHKVISNNQFGFQKGKSTVDAIFILHSIITKTLSSGKKLYCVFIDFEKAFDKIDRSLLWHKLLSENMSSKMVRAIKAMYSVVRSCIRFNSSKSDFFSSHIGVKQGDPSSALMFMMFINDISQNINSNLDGIFTCNELKFFLILYADDQVLFANNPESLQSMLRDVEQYCHTWGLKINTSKTKTMIFEKGRHTKFDFSLNNTILETVTSFKYLGIHLFKNGNWFRTQKIIAQHGSLALHNLFKILNQTELITSEKCKAYLKRLSHHV